MAERFLTPEQAAGELQVSTRTVYEWLRRGELPGRQFGDRVWRILESDVLTPGVRGLLEEGLICSARRWIEEGAKAFEKALDMNPKYNLANFHLGEMYYRWGRYSEAEAPLLRAIDLHPEWVAAYGVLGLTYNHWGRYEAAEMVLRKLVELAPGHAEGFYQLGYCLTQQQSNAKDPEAVEAFQKAIDLDPSNRRYYLFLPDLLFKLGDLNAARDLYLRLRNVHGDLADRLSKRIEYAEKFGHMAAYLPFVFGEPI
jgi:excisionase family DNA binding protein